LQTIGGLAGTTLMKDGLNYLLETSEFGILCNTGINNIHRLKITTRYKEREK
jgi:hypothetical protein